MLTLIQYICLFFYEQFKNAFLEIVRIDETVATSENVTQADINAMLVAADIHGAFVILSTALTTITVIYLFIYGFYDEILVDVDGEEITVKKFRKAAIILFVASTIVDIVSKVI